MNPSFDQLRDTYQIGQGVTKEADRRRNWAIGLFVSGLVLFPLPFAFRNSSPNFLKGLFYPSSIGCFLSAAYCSRRDSVLYRMGAQFDQASREHLAADLNASHGVALKQKEASAWVQQLGIIQQLPESMQIGALHRWGLADLVTPYEEPIEVASEPVPEGLVLPAGLMNQQRLEDSIADRASEELAIDWFNGWARRCGIVCGESGDGKTYMLVNIVLAGFIREFGDRGSVFICDPDYGSSHGDSEPNTWLDLEVDRHVFTEYEQCFQVLLRVSKIVEDRIRETKHVAIDNQKSETKKPKPKFDPVLFIIDEIPALMAAWTDAQKAEAVTAIANILRRGLKQNVTFKVGTQTLAVSRTNINKDVLQQTELVMLWSSAQMPENYGNIGLLPGKAAKIVEEVSLYPRKTHDRYVCVRFADKKLLISGIPIVAPVQVVQEGETARSPVAEASEPVVTEGDAYAQLKVFWQSDPDDDVGLAREFTRLTGRELAIDKLDALKMYFRRI